MTKALRGINLGGWLVAERWMTPQLFKGVRQDGESALVRELGRSEAKIRLEAHRQSFITEADFKWIKDQGFDFVRLPVGYWLFEPTDEFLEGEGYVQKAFDWAQKHGLRILLDFHGLQGSQNGYDHSGAPGKVRLYRRKHRRAALKTLGYLCETYGRSEVLIGLEIINEAQIRLGWYDWWRVLKFYDGAVRLAERHLRPETKIIVSDAFEPHKMARALARRGYSSRVLMDMHLYRMFGKKHLGMSHEKHMAAVKDEWTRELEEVSKTFSIMVGEWSAALPAAAYVTTGDEREVECIRYFLAQRDLFDERAWAHSYWSYKVLGGGVWDYRKISQLLAKHASR
jgi:glucan 1,3-beta-glucosidase